MTHVRAWKFLPPAGGAEAFARAYREDGRWAELFRRAEGYIGTQLFRPDRDGGWWLTLDRWESASAFAAFSRDFAAEYRALDAELEGIAGEEHFVGAFEEPD